MEWWCNLAKLPKKYIKRYGISKKAWSEYRKSKKTSSKRKYGAKGPRKNVRRSKSMRGMSGLTKGVVTGIATGIINQLIPINIAGADLMIAGYFMKDSTVSKIGAISLGRSLAGSFTGMATGNGLSNIFEG